jgi:hypothetical protein
MITVLLSGVEMEPSTNVSLETLKLIVNNWDNHLPT